MTNERKAYTAEFKKEAVKLVTEKCYPVSEIAKNLKINETNIRRWIAEFKSGIKVSHQKKSEQKPDEIKILERKIRQLTMENEILKKATAFFAKECNKDMSL